MLNHFSRPDVVYPYRNRDYYIAGFTFFCVAVSLVIDGSASYEAQNMMGVVAWIFLFGLLIGENKEVRMQVVVAVAFATAGEHFASIYMEGYTYRFGNVPLYVPPGHGMVYLTAVALSRSRFFLMYAKELAIFVIVSGGLWSLWGISGIPEQGDQVGAFFICTWLGIIGTAAGTWKWASIEPVFNWTQGNPPSGVAAWYCLVDAVAIGFAPKILNGLQKMNNWYKTSLEK